jgi:hypothetical protein
VHDRTTILHCNRASQACLIRAALEDTKSMFVSAAALRDFDIMNALFPVSNAQLVVDEVQWSYFSPGSRGMLVLEDCVFGACLIQANFSINWYQ